MTNMPNAIQTATLSVTDLHYNHQHSTGWALDRFSSTLFTPPLAMPRHLT